MQQHDVAFLGPVEGLPHAVEVDRLRPEIGEPGRLDLEPGRGEDRRVIGPGRRSEPDGGSGVGLADQLGAESQRAGAARGLQGRDPAGDPLAGAENVGPKTLGEAGVAFRPQVFLAVLAFQQNPLRLLDRLQDGRDAHRVAIDADAEVDLACAAVGVECLDQAEQAIGRLGVQRFEHAILLPISGADAQSMMKSVRAKNPHPALRATFPRGEGDAPLSLREREAAKRQGEG